jgi:hypothetical protein
MAFADKVPRCTGNETEDTLAQKAHEKQFSAPKEKQTVDIPAIFVDVNGLIAGFHLPDILPKPIQVLGLLLVTDIA